MSASDAAAVLRTPARTLRHWRRRAGRRPACRGRPCKTAPPQSRRAVLRFLKEVSGPAVGLEALRALFPDVPRCVLADLLGRYRRVWRRRHRQHGWRLSWKRPGAVWAIDFSEPPYPIDGVFEQLFAVRDLASHRQLAWTPVTGPTAEQAVAVLRELFRKYGPPLVIKCDNGSAFISEAFQAFLAEHGVLLLYSPPLHPQYNGAVERSNGVLKTYTQQHAASEQHPFRWTSDDVEAARQLANTLSRPWGHRRETPDEAWQGRTPITDDQRRPFRAEAERQRLVARADLGLPVTGDLSRTDQARLDRMALERALCSLGYLEMRRENRPPKKAKRPARAALAAAAASAAPPASPPPVSPAENNNSALAATASADTMRVNAGVDRSVTATASAPPPTHVEPAPSSQLARPITPLISQPKAAMILD